MMLVSLTLGLMGLDELHLRVLATSSGDKFEKKSAQEGLRISWHIRIKQMLTRLHSTEIATEGQTLGIGRKSLCFFSTKTFENAFKVLLLGNVVRLYVFRRFPIF